MLVALQVTFAYGTTRLTKALVSWIDAMRDQPRLRARQACGEEGASTEGCNQLHTAVAKPFGRLCALAFIWEMLMDVFTVFDLPNLPTVLMMVSRNHIDPNTMNVLFHSLGRGYYRQQDVFQ